MTDRVKFETIAIHADTHMAWRGFRRDMSVQLARDLTDNDLAELLLDAGREKLDSDRGNL